MEVMGAKMSTRARASLALTLFFAAIGVTGCSSTSEPPRAVAAVPVVTAPAPPAPGAVGGPIGQSLDEKDRATAIAAQQDAVSSGVRKSWRGEKGTYGFVTLGPENGACRDYTHKIYVNGRPQEAKGQACRENGEWRITS